MDFNMVGNTLKIIIICKHSPNQHLKKAFYSQHHVSFEHFHTKQTAFCYQNDQIF